MRAIHWPLESRLHLCWQSPAANALWLAAAVAAGLVLAAFPLSNAALLLAGTAVLLVILVEPLAGLALTLVAGPFTALESVKLGGYWPGLGQLLLALTLASWLAHGVARGRILPLQLSRITGQPNQAARLIPLAIVAFIGVGACSLLRAASLIDGLKELAKWVQMAVVAWLVADSAGRRGGPYWIAGTVLLSGISQALIGVWQFGLRGHGPEHFEILGGYYRAYGTFEQPNPYAGFLGLALPVAVGWGIGLLALVRLGQLDQRHLRPPAGRALLGISIRQLIALLVMVAAAGVLAAAMIMSWSRGAWMGAAAGMAALLFFLPRRRGLGWALALGMVAVAWFALQTGLLPPAMSNRLTGFAAYVQFDDVRGVDVTAANYAVVERVAHWQAALNMVDARPWLGVGLGNYEAAYPDHDLINWPYALGHAHNYYLNLLAETGVLGLTVYLAFWGCVVWLTARAIRSVPYPQRGLALGLMGAWVHLSVHHLVDNLFVNNVHLHLGAMLGMLYLIERSARSELGPASSS